jgi:hypothetical protein
LPCNAWPLDQRRHVADGRLAGESPGWAEQENSKEVLLQKAIMDSRNDTELALPHPS